MKIVVLCPHFAPDTAPTGTVMTGIVEGLVDRGHEIHVVTSLPWYRDHQIEEEWTGRLLAQKQRSGVRSLGFIHFHQATNATFFGERSGLSDLQPL